MKRLSDIRDKRILYAATKNSDYLRLVQEIRLLRENGNTVTVISSPSKSYPKRLMYVYRQLMKVRMADYDMSFIGFAPQLIMPLFRRKLKKKPVVMDFFISMYDTLCYDRKKFRPKSLPGRLLKRIDRRTLAAADLAVCDTKAHGSYFCREFGFPKEKMSVLYLEADSSIYYPREAPENKDFTVLYFGSVLPLQGIPVILKAIDLLKDEKGLRFVFVGPLGSSERTGENITEYIEWLPQEELAERIAGADLCLAGHFDGSIMKAKRTIAGKTYIYRAMGKPVILGDNPANHELYSESDEGVYFCEMGSPEKLAELIKRIKDQRCV
ncbi:glycosyltransferase [uncultured Ruminococcus sp.]|uniref:glycosyltransferase n=1 Tax=uncultured Ruminococcus sp. TaxID=165186 RepID=UPI0026280DD9|nr:glycosyltransferase [uncultured Ruminococcus sp.]